MDDRSGPCSRSRWRPCCSPWRSWRRPPRSPPLRRRPPAAAAPSGPGSITLHVQSARSVERRSRASSTRTTPSTKYKWLVNVDDTGDPGTSAAPGHREAACRRRRQGGSTDPDYADSLPVALDPQHLRLRADRRPGRPDRPQRHHGARQPARREVPHLGDRRRLQDRRRALHRRRRDPDGHGRDEPDAAAPDARMRIQVFNDNAPVDATYEVDAEQGLRGFTAHLTDVFGDGERRLLRQRRCAPSTSTRTPTAPARSSSTPTTARSSTPTRSTGRCVSDAPARSSSPTSAPTGTPPR